MKKTDNDLDFDLGSNDDFDFSPNEPDSLQIEGDVQKVVEDVKETVVSAAEEVETTETEVKDTAENLEEQVSSEANTAAEEVEAVVEASQEAEPVKEEMQQDIQQEISRAQKAKSGKKTEKKEKKKGSIWPIILLLLLVALCAAGWYYYKNVWSKATKPAPVVEKQEVPQQPVEQAPIPEEPMVIDTVPPQPPIPPEPRVATAMKVPTKGWLIAYRALPNEVEAIKVVAELSYVDGYPCGYYWIPDARQGDKMFKIYIGPFSTKSAAEAILPRVQTKRADAYIYTEDKNLIDQE